MVIRNTKLYVNREEGFVGTSLKKDEYVADCADIDDVIVFRDNGSLMVTKVASKTFIGKGIIHVAVFKKRDKRTVYNMIYKDGAKGPNSYMKRFNVTSVTRDKEYYLGNNDPKSKVLYFTVNPNGEAEVVTINLRAVGSIKKLKWDIDFSDLAIKGRAVRGNLVSKYSIKKVEFKEAGVSTLKPRKIWFDDTVRRLNVDERGELLGEFRAEDKLLIATQSGKIKAVKPELTMHFDNDMIVLEKWKPNKPISAIYFDGNKERYYVKRFLIESSEKEEIFISEHEKSQLQIVVTDYRPMLEVIFSKRSLEKMEVNIEDFISVKGIKALGNQLTTDKIKQVNVLESLPYEEAPEKIEEEVDTVEEEIKEATLVDVPLAEVEEKPKLTFETKEEKAKKALERALKKKKAKDDDDQPTLF